MPWLAPRPRKPTGAVIAATRRTAEELEAVRGRRSQRQAATDRKKEPNNNRNPEPDLMTILFYRPRARNLDQEALRERCKQGCVNLASRRGEQNNSHG